MLGYLGSSPASAQLLCCGHPNGHSCRGCSRALPYLWMWLLCLGPHRFGQIWDYTCNSMLYPYEFLFWGALASLFSKLYPCQKYRLQTPVLDGKNQNLRLKVFEFAFQDAPKWFPQAAMSDGRCGCFSLFLGQPPSSPNFLSLVCFHRVIFWYYLRWNSWVEFSLLPQDEQSSFCFPIGPLPAW